VCAIPDGNYDNFAHVAGLALRFDVTDLVSKKHLKPLA
jgi:hypothetical protein